ncbi:ABC transporter substrate-binding protein [Celerinatantimonas sp. YJH-8]|uniref:ABC transporter substrate-binding protein n=1 Tax=Celerinatantimonas sp. YJH-8 TaxID=3228714 RepID=UPI0038BFE29C
MLKRMIIGCCAALSLTAGLAQAKPLTDGVLTIGMEVAYPPFESYQNKQPVGFDVELVHALAKEMGLKPDIKDTPFPSLILGIKAHRFDMVISGMYIVEKRLKQADALPYITTGTSIMVRKNADFLPKAPEDLCGRTIAIQKGTVWLSKLQGVSNGYCASHNLGAIQINEYPTTAECTQALLSNHADAQLQMAAASQQILEKLPNRVQISSEKQFYPQTMGMYFPKGDTWMKQQLSEALAKVKASGEFQKLLDKYHLNAQF